MTRKSSLFRDLQLSLERLEQRAMLDASVVIAEFMAVNVGTLDTWDPANRKVTFSPDWVEIANHSDQEFDLSRFHLTDNDEDPLKWEFPVDTTIPANGNIVVFASRRTQTNDGVQPLHANFALRPEGEYLALTDTVGNVVHAYDSYPKQVPDVSYGLTADGQEGYLKTATPGAENLAGRFSGMVADTAFSIDRGYYSSPFVVAISTETPTATIRYTLDGSEPSPDTGLIYTTPIPVATTTTLRAAAFRDDWVSSNIDAQTYIFSGDVLRQNGQDISSARWGRSGPDWDVDPEIVNHADPSVRVVESDFQTIPTVSLSLDFDQMWGDAGIYIDGEDTEIRTAVEYLPHDSDASYQARASVQIVGSASVNRWTTEKLSMRLRFHEDFGESQFSYAVFGPEAVDEFDTIVLDARTLNTWTYGGPLAPRTERRRAQFVRDQYIADLQNEMGGFAPHGRNVHLYINGLYWGMYMLHERPDDNFAANYLGGENLDYNIVKNSDLLSGDPTSLDELRTLWARDYSDPTEYASTARNVDVEGLIDYMLLNFYAGNYDWGPGDNLYASRRADDGVWRFHSWDAEATLGSLTQNNIPAGAVFGLHDALMENEEYRLRFADRSYKHFFNDGVLTPSRAAELYKIRVDAVDVAVRAESARWGDSQRIEPYTRNDWLAERSRLLDEYFPNRTSVVVGQLRVRGWLPLEGLHPPNLIVDGSEQNRGGAVAIGSEVVIASSGGEAYYTEDGTDPRMVGGEVSTTANSYAKPIRLTQTTTIKSRIRNEDGTWSPLQEASFFPATATDSVSLRISEINYHPGNVTANEKSQGFGDSDDFEFVEIVNVSSQAISLYNVSLAQESVGGNIEGIGFDFREGQIFDLAPSERVVVVEDADAFYARYGSDIPVAGEWSGRLSNGGETVRLVLGDTVIHEVEYDDDWFADTDGAGYSLQLVNEASSPVAASKRYFWRPSSAINGTPGSADKVVPGDANLDGKFDTRDLVLVFQANLFEDPTGNASWVDGDWNGDGKFTTSDLVLAFAFYAG
ncbi:chitobiase/beta-hexosaminidase C-terminal domain-containing protein [Planctomycetota bacterium]